MAIISNCVVLTVIIHVIHVEIITVILSCAYQWFVLVIQDAGLCGESVPKMILDYYLHFNQYMLLQKILNGHRLKFSGPI